jgi:outer membrane protein assembly factor BamB
MEIEMYLKYSTSLITLILLLSIIFPIISFTTTATLNTDGDDGIWTAKIDGTSNQYLAYHNTQYDSQEEAILLNKSSNVKTYDYNDNANHEAFGYPTNLVALYQLPIFKPYRPFKERRFGFDEYIDIETINGNNNQGYADRSSEGKLSIVQHFRFKIDITENLIDSISVQWIGKALGDAEIVIYYYRYVTQTNNIGGWTQLTQSQSNGADITLIGDIPGSDIPNAINNEKILDVYVVATRQTSSCTLFTDYINITTQTTEGYDLTYGIIETKNPVNPGSISNTEKFYWEQLTWRDYTDKNTDIRYQLLYENSSNNYIPIPEEDFPGNEDGFSQSPILLNMLDIERYGKLKINANMTTSNPESSPRLFELTITWQTHINQWKDLFNSDYRIDIKNRLKLDEINDEGYLNLTLSQGNWPMLGFNLQNTRASDTKGSNTNNIWWYAEVVGDDVRHEMLSPILYEGNLYATHLFSNVIYWCDDIITNPPNSKKNFKNLPIDFGNDLHIRNSPATINNLLIIPTGEEDFTGVTNLVYVVDISNPLNLVIDEYIYDGGNICYGAAPAVDDNYIYLTSYDPNTFDSVNYDTKFIVLNFDNLQTEHMIYNLPANSFTTPAVQDNIAVVCCKHRTGKSVFAFDIESKTSLWNKTIGEVGLASPVIYEGKVFITSKTMGNIKVTALDLTNGTQLWAKTIGASTKSADFTPTVFNDVLYAVLPKGTITALDTDSGESLWSKDVVEIGQQISASPSYADGKLYIPLTADSFDIGSLIAIDTETHETKWRFNTFYSPRANKVPSSPIITNGMVIFGDDNGRIYSIGEYVKPDQQLEGTLISMPIELPPGAWWDKFYADAETEKDKNSITYQLLDENKKFLTKLKNGDTIALGQGATTRKVRLRADFTAQNLSVNPKLFSWNITFTKDEKAPVFDIKSFQPGAEGWLNEIVDQFSITVQDKGTGLLITSAEYTLTYDSTEGAKTKKRSASCTGSNGTINPQTVTANIGNESFFNNITALKEIIFSIKDLANNLNTTKITFRQDTQKPTSNLQNETIEESYNTPSILLTVTAQDPGTPQNASGVASIELKYRYSDDLEPTFSGGWTTHSTITTLPYEFDFTAIEGGGWYELTTIATDLIGNSELEPERGDASFLMDSMPPELPDYGIIDDWYNDLPEFSITFKDDYLLDKIEYRPNFETEWTTIETGIQQKIYSRTWSLKSSYWEQMNEGEEYFLHLQITDYLGNKQRIVEDEIILYKDTQNPNVAIEAPNIGSDWTWEDTFDITAFAEDSQGSGIQTVTLEYSFSEDNSTWGDWIEYEDDITTPDITWTFKAEDGNGFYKFQITALDGAGNQAQSILIIGLNIFPATLVGVLFTLLIILIIVTLFFIWWKKKHPIKK